MKTNMNAIKKYDEMYQLLSQNKLDLRKNITDDLKCTKCKTILINACQIGCGCRYCRHCVDELIQHGHQFCVGNSEYCSITDLLSNCIVDYRANKEISMISVECPEPNCSFVSELINMDSHSRCCWSDFKCPLSYYGCENDLRMTNEMAIEHCRLMQLQHQKIICNVIGNVNNEIECLNRKLESKSAQSDTDNEEIRFLKLENENMRKEMRELKESYDNKLEQLTTEIVAIKDGMNTNGDCSLKGVNLASDITKEEIEEIKKQSNEHDLEIRSIHQYLNLENLDKFLWKIGPTKEISTSIWKGSEYFYEAANSYKMRLWLWSDLWKLWIYLYVYSGTNDEDLIWPFKRNVTVKVFDRNDDSKLIFISKCCTISKPDKNSMERSDPFLFYHNKLYDEQIYNCNTAVEISISHE